MELINVVQDETEWWVFVNEELACPKGKKVFKVCISCSIIMV
jgi:hypothetical protein